MASVDLLATARLGSFALLYLPDSLLQIRRHIQIDTVLVEIISAICFDFHSHKNQSQLDCPARPSRTSSDRVFLGRPQPAAPSGAGKGGKKSGVCRRLPGFTCGFSIEDLGNRTAKRTLRPVAVGGSGFVCYPSE